MWRPSKPPTLFDLKNAANLLAWRRKVIATLPQPEPRRFDVDHIVNLMPLYDIPTIVRKQRDAQTAFLRKQAE